MVPAAAFPSIHWVGKRKTKHHNKYVAVPLTVRAQLMPRTARLPPKQSASSAHLATSHVRGQRERARSRPSQVLRHAHWPRPRAWGPSPPHTHPSPPFPAGDPLLFNHLSERAERRLRPQTARNFPPGGREELSAPLQSSAQSWSAEGGTSPSTPSPPSLAPSPQHVPMHLLSGGGGRRGRGKPGPADQREPGRGPALTAHSPHPAAPQSSEWEGVRHRAGERRNKCLLKMADSPPQQLQPLGLQRV